MNDSQIWELQWSVEHLPPEAPDDAHLEPPLQDGENDFWHIDPLTGPFRTPLVFGAAFVAVDVTDYPYNNLNWPLVTAPLLEALEVEGHPSITPFPVRLIDVELREADDPRWNASSAEEAVNWALAQPDLVRDDVSVLHVAPLAGVLDLSASRYHPFADGVGIRSVDTFVFRAPAGGFPPVFRVAEFPLPLFITAQARTRLNEAGIRGPVYRLPGGPLTQDEVDHPVVL